ncbi:hypothetical protein F5Y07DRAFT_212964 [Xylaria sp. FL0933]|nr:hypothetical protein F5Y07DRAFT_212964 [Xylaria sp. FL0933]
MEIPDMLNDPPFSVHNERTTEGSPALCLRAGELEDEDEKDLFPPLPSSSSAKSPARAGIKTEPVGRNKKPWDAGGFSLPRVSESEFDELEIFGATPPAREGDTVRQFLNHRYSTSGSSFSSSIPSSTPRSHTRFSSISTIGDVCPMEPSPKASFLEPSRSDYPSYIGQCPQQLGRNEIMSPAIETPMSSMEYLSTQGYSRPGSPSDAIIIPKLSKRLDKAGVHEAPCSTQPISKFGMSLIPPDFDSNRGHKRTCSAPGPHDNSSINQSNHLAHRASQSITPAPAFDQRTPNIFLNSPETRLQGPQNSRMNCEFEENCDTNSTLRKAISHIFGRNKLCTRAIPEEVWVHWCRKHYQRDRYRELHEYTKRQCSLVMDQINRIQEWSDVNSANGVATVVQDWTLSMRKRERERNSKSKRLPNEESDREDDPNAFCTGSGVPPWLKDLCDKRYSTDEILAIAARIKHEIASSKAQSYPEIEILPNIPTNSVEDATSKTQGKQKPSSSTVHKRSRSLSVTGHPEPNLAQWSGQTIYMPASDTEKRQRTMPFISREYAGYTHSREIPTMLADARSTVRLPHRPIPIPRTRGSRIREASYASEAARISFNHMRYPLPTPIQPTLPSRHVTQLESNISGPGRLGHQRSISDYISRSENMPFSFQVDGPSPPAPFSTPHHEPAYGHHGTSATNNYHIIPRQGFHLPNESEYLQPTSHHGQYVDRSRHSRHQSTPNATIALSSYQTNRNGQGYDPNHIDGQPGNSRHPSSLPRLPLHYG